MSTPTVPVTVTLAAQDGTPYEGVTVRARLSKNEVYEGIVISDQAEGVTDADGVAVLDLFPNAPSPTGLGTQGTTYRFTASIPGGRALNVLARVPNEACRLENILVGDEIGSLSDAELALLQAQSAVTTAATSAAAAEEDAQQTALDRVATGEDRDATAADALATGQDRAQTALDRIATAADRVQTGLDRTAAAASAAAAAVSENQAAAIVLGDFLQSGTGAVARTFSAKARERVSVEDFGAVGDGSTDDTDAFNAGLSAVAASGIGVLRTAPNKDYKITALVTVPTGASLVMGDGSELVYTGSGTAVRVEPAAPDDAAETYATSQFVHRMNVIRVRKSSISWHDSGGNTDTTSKGIQMINQRYSRHVLSAQGFYVGIECCGFDSDPDTSVSYSAGGPHVANVYTIYARNNFKHILTRRNGAGGYANQNTVQGGQWRNDGAFTATGTRGFDGSDGANGWSFINVNTEGTTCEQIYRFDGLYHTIVGGRFENATAGMIKVLDGGSVTIVGGYIGEVGSSLVSADTGGTYIFVKENGSIFQNGIAANACMTGLLSGASGLFHQYKLSDGKVVSESNQSAAWKFYTTAGKYNATTNPSGLTNPTFDLDCGTRVMRFRSATDDASADGTVGAWAWSTANSFSIFRQTWHWENSNYDRPLRLGATARLWSDTNGVLRYKNSSPSNSTDGIALVSLSGSATYDPASLADGAGATTTVTATGAALGDFASASFSNDLQGITLTAWVSAADTVSVRFQNETGGVVDLASGTLRVRVSKV